MDQAYLFNTGNDYHSYNLLGSRPYIHEDGEQGFHFAVWAPHARSVNVIGDFNDWNGEADPMKPFRETGIWVCDVPDAVQWDRYKYKILGADGRTYDKIDPFARHCETRPNNASILYDFNDYEWQDADYRENCPDALDPRPINIYELHLGSWRRFADGNFMNYRLIAEDLVDYCLTMGYTHVELMPVMEHPLDDSWGYQITAYYAVTSRFGTPADFKYMVDLLHRNGIAVILDWVPAHFPKNLEGLIRFDGTPCFEYGDPRIGEHREWGTYVFNYEKAEVRSFLISNAVFWIDEFHVDGIRVDAVSSMLYRNYGRTEFLPNINGGTENIEAISFLQDLNEIVRENYPHVMMIAEESTAWPKVSCPVADGGLGFTHKWNMGWMHDTLDYFETDYYARVWHHDELCFSMMYAFSENFILCLSHDEVVHGKKSLLDKMPGDEWRKFASFRTLVLYMIAHPGSKLLFMGAEFGQYIEWRFYEQLEWFMLQHESHRLLKDFVAKINHYYIDKKALWINDRSWDGFDWIDTTDRDNCIFLFVRKGETIDEKVIVVLNMVPVPQEKYKIAVDFPGEYSITMNTDDMNFGGSGYPTNAEGSTTFTARKGPWMGRRYFIEINIPPLSGLFIERTEEGPAPDSADMDDENDRNVTEEQEKDAADSKAAEAKALDVGTAEAEETDRK